MAERVIVSLVDDLDGTQAEETVEFALDGKNYELDLSAANAAKLRDLLADYVTAARRAGVGRRSRSGKPPRSVGRSDERERSAAVRQWARENGIKVSDRGRIAKEVLEAFNEHTAN
jgi:hypothetical protein